MSMQYPYRLEKFIVNESWQDENGDFIPEQSKWEFVCKCRDEAGNGKQIQGTDGTIYTYSSLIQCPKGVGLIDTGTKVRVKDIMNNVRVLEAPVIYSRKDQLHTRIWV